MAEPEEEQPNPSQLTGQIKTAQGQAYQTIASVLPESANPGGWAESGKQLERRGQTEVNNAKTKAATEAVFDGASAKLKSAAGYVTGDQEKQTRGNMENEQAQWKYKAATSDDILDKVPVPSGEGIKGKLTSVEGMVKGDQQLQKEGNLRAEKAAWKDGV